MNGRAIIAEGLVRDFGRVRAVDGVDLSIAEGEIYGFLGPNGAGKSTVVRMLTTLLLPTAGRALIAGLDVVERPKQVRMRIGAALQDASLDNKQTGRELLRLQASLFGLSQRKAKSRIQELERLIDIGDAMDRLISTYSGGMKRRLDLAAALIHSPKILSLDEPTTGLDPISRVRVWEEVQRVNKKLGVTIFLTTQYLEEADSLAGRVGIIDDGKLAAEGPPAHLKRTVGSDIIIAEIEGDMSAAHSAVRNVKGVSAVEAHETELTISVENGPASISRVALALHHSEIAPTNLTLRTPTLDDVFLSVTGTRLEVDAPVDTPAAEDES